MSWPFLLRKPRKFKRICACLLHQRYVHIHSYRIKVRTRIIGLWLGSVSWLSLGLNIEDSSKPGEECVRVFSTGVAELE